MIAFGLKRHRLFMRSAVQVVAIGVVAVRVGRAVGQRGGVRDGRCVGLDDRGRVVHGRDGDGRLVDLQQQAPRYFSTPKLNISCPVEDTSKFENYIKCPQLCEIRTPRLGISDAQQCVQLETFQATKCELPKEDSPW